MAGAPPGLATVVSGQAGTVRVLGVMVRRDAPVRPRPRGSLVSVRGRHRQCAASGGHTLQLVRRAAALGLMGIHPRWCLPLAVPRLGAGPSSDLRSFFSTGDRAVGEGCHPRRTAV
jgi:hypothetical protein